MKRTHHFLFTAAFSATLAALSLSASIATAQERGQVLFADDFATAGTFAENWRPQGGARIAPMDGGLFLPPWAKLQMARETPAEFFAEATFIQSPKLAKNTFTGFVAEELRFGFVGGSQWTLTYIPIGADEPKSLSGKIPSSATIETNKAVRLSIARTVTDKAAICRLLVNGEDVARVEAPLPTAISPTAFKPLSIECSGAAMTLDDFELRAVRRADESPNLVINSGFEYDEDGFPPYFSRRGNFRLENWEAVPYDDYIALWSLDRKDRHSGRQALRVRLDERISTPDLLNVWGHGTEAGSPAVFSAWMKADRPGVEVSFSYGRDPLNAKRSASKKFTLTTDWARYELAVTNSPGRGILPSTSIVFPKGGEGTIWIDDVQIEIIRERITQADIDSGRTFATPYRPSDTDRIKFAEKALQRMPPFSIPRLPEGTAPSIDLDAWKGAAHHLAEFYNGVKPATHRSEAFVACDSENVYVGIRCHGEQWADPQAEKKFGLFGRGGLGVEAFFDPAADGAFYQMAMNSQSRREFGARRDTTWKGAWTGECRENKEAGAVDYFLTFPIGDFASPRIKDSWPVNFGRNDRLAGECDCTTRTYGGGFQEHGLWAVATLPDGIAANYRLGVEEVTRAPAADGGDLYTVRLSNASGRDRTLRAACLNASDGNAPVAEKDVTVPDGGTASFSFTTEKPMRMALVRLTEAGKPMGNGKFAVPAASAVSLLGRLNFYMREKEAAWRVECALPEPETLRAELVCAGRTTKADRCAPSFRMAMPLDGVADGRHEAVLTLYDREGRAVATARDTLDKRPYTKCAAQISRFSRSVVHDGKPRFFFAPFLDDFVWIHSWSTNRVRDAVGFFAKEGFKGMHALVPLDTNMTSRGYSRLDLGASWLKDVADAGMVADLWIGGCEKLTDEAVTNMLARLSSESIVAVQALDEPELGHPSDWARDYMRRMRRLITDYPVVMNNTYMGPPIRFGNLETDIVMIDAYLTAGEGQTVGEVVRQVDVMLEAGREEGKPSWYFLAGANTPLHYKEPSYGEQMAQCYGCVAAGCTGISLFTAFPKTPGNWRAYRQLAREFGVLGDVIVSEEECPQATADADARTLRLLTKRHKGDVYLIACNVSKEPLGRVAITLPAALGGRDARAEVLFEDRFVPLSGGVLADVFAGHERHVYRIRNINER